MGKILSKNIEYIGSPGIIRDIPGHKIPDNAITSGNNIKFGKSGIESLAGDIETLSTASTTPKWIGFFPPITNPKWVYADLSNVYVVEGSTHTEITRVSGTYNASADERWMSTVLNGVGILNNTIDVPQGWTDFDPSTKLIDLPNWDTNRRCKSIRSFKNFLVALYMTDSSVEKPYRIVWSDSAVPGSLPGSWDTTDPATDAREFDLAETSDYLVDQLVLGDINIIYKEHSVWGMQYIGPPYYFKFWKILSKNGLLHRDCVSHIPGGHLVVTQDDMIIHSGQREQYQSILSGNQRKWLFSNIDTTNFKNSFLVGNPKEEEIYFCFPETGETYATLAIIWSYRDKSFGIRELSETPFAAVGPIGDSIDDDPQWGE